MTYDSLEVATRTRRAPGADVDLLRAVPDEAVISVNGCELLELVRAVEQPFAELEGKPHLAGQYLGLPPDLVFFPSQHLLGSPDALYSDLVRTGTATKPALLMCECGEPGCWPLCARVTVLQDTVTWTDFEQPHRAGHDRDAQWSYASLGPFTFARAPYEAALSS